MEAATPAAITPAPIARPVPTVTPPAIGVDRDRPEFAPGVLAAVPGAFAGAVSAAINGRLREVARAMASSFFMFVLLEWEIPEGYGLKGIAICICIASYNLVSDSLLRFFNGHTRLTLS
ncbi:hypothetical protein D3C73_984450 [compost metagenome]